MPKQQQQQLNNAPSSSAASSYREPAAVAAESPARKADTLPLVSAFNKADMKAAIDLMQADRDLAESIAVLQAERDAGKDKLAQLAAKYEAAGAGAGFRYGNLAFYYSEQPGRKTLDKQRLIRYLSVEELEGCYKTGEPFVKMEVREITE